MKDHPAGMCRDVDGANGSVVVTTPTPRFLREPFKYKAPPSMGKNGLQREWAYYGLQPPEPSPCWVGSFVYAQNMHTYRITNGWRYLALLRGVRGCARNAGNAFNGWRQQDGDLHRLVLRPWLSCQGLSITLYRTQAVLFPNPNDETNLDGMW